MRSLDRWGNYVRFCLFLFDHVPRRAAAGVIPRNTVEQLRDESHLTQNFNQVSAHLS